MRAAKIGAGKFVLALRNEVDQARDVERVLAERPGRDLPVQDRAGDVGVVGRDLAPALRAVVGGDADEADELVAEGLDAADLHASIACAITWSAR